MTTKTQRTTRELADRAALLSTANFSKEWETFKVNLWWDFLRRDHWVALNQKLMRFNVRTGNCVLALTNCMEILDLPYENEYAREAELMFREMLILQLTLILNR